MNKKRGFTLVELLIVIVVIAILAAISVVAYNGIQQRTYATKAAATVDTYVKLIEMYKIDHGRYPTTSAGSACLSASGTLPAEGPFAANQCDSDYGMTIDEDLNEKLLFYASSLPNGSLPAVDYDGNGALLRGIIYNEGYDTAEIFYAINGDYDCPRGFKDNWRGEDTSTRGTINICWVSIGSSSGSSSVIY